MKKTKTNKPAANSASVPRPANRKSPAVKDTGQHLLHQRILLAKREEILAMVKQKETDLSSSEIGDEADVASQTLEREMMFEMTNGERIVLDDIEAALRRIEKGEFGLCESCHKRISSERLRAMPWARYCIQCQSKSESPAR